jgi:dTMP kinase
MGFVVIEGLDGSGKSTQMVLLKDYLKRQGILFKYLHFPRLEEGIYGKLIARFLRGEMGTNEDVDPYLVALIFAGDRSDAAPVIRKWMKEGALVIVDRYVYSNIAFQCAKLESLTERDRLRDWILELEFGYNRLPRPDVNLFLHVPLEFIRSQLENPRDGEDRSYLKGAKDIHESSLEFQEQVRLEYLRLREKVDDISLIDCSDEAGGMKAPDLIFESLVERLKKFGL